MVRHYVLQAVRVLRKARLYAAINVLGLSVALGVTVLIVLFVQDEFSYDDWHEHLDRIVRVDDVDFNPDGSVEEQQPQHPYPFAEAFAGEHPDVEAVVRFSDTDVVVRIDGRMQEQAVLFADDTFFDVFTYRAVAGRLEGSLDALDSAVLTAPAAERLFGTTAVVGRQFEVRFEDTYEAATVTAVVAPPPSGTHLPFELLLPFERTPLVYPWIANRTDRWNASSFPTYALLKEGTDLEAAREITTRLWETFYPDRTARGREAGWWTGEGNPSGLDLVPLRDLHLRHDVRAAFVATSNPLYSYILMGIAGLILFLACTNFTLLAVGQSGTRASEIGVRKALGARRSEIALQFGGEAVLMALLGLLGGLALANLLLPAASTLSGKTLSLDLAGSPALMLTLLALTLLTGIAAGFYPSVVASRHRPVEALRGRFSITGSGSLTRALLVTQFVFSVALVAGALAMQSQLDYLQSRDVGYNADDVIVLSTSGMDAFGLRDHLKSSLEGGGDVEQVAGISLSLNRGYSSTGWMVERQEKRAYEYNVDAWLTEILRMDVLAGRSFDPRRATDSTVALVNEAFAADWGWTPAEAVGKRILGRGNEPEIIGVLRDTNFRSQHEAVEPTMFFMENGWLGYLLVRPTAGRTAEAIAATEQAWKAYVPEVPFSYTFMDQDVARAYANDQRWSRIVRFAAGIAILVACLGLFGLAALTVSRRTKEIGIRKVLGASVQGVAMLVSREFALIVAVATVIAAPLAWLGLGRWLDGFAYRIDLSPWLFVGAGFLVLLIAVATVSYHAVRAAVADPVKSLRYE